MTIKYNKPYLEICNNELALKPRLSTGSNNYTINYLCQNNIIKNINKIKNIPNLFHFELSKNNKSIYAFIFDIVPSCTSDPEDKRVQVKTSTKELIDYLQKCNNKINIVAGYCEFGDSLFCYNNETSFIFNESKDNTSVHIKLHWLLKCINETNDFILENNYKHKNDKYKKLLITNNVQMIIDCLDGTFDIDNNSLHTINRIDKDIEKYKKIVNLKINEYNLVNKNHKNVIYDQRIKYSLTDIELFSNLINEQEINFTEINDCINVKDCNDDLDDYVFSTNNIKFKKITEKIYTHTIIDPLKIECIFNVILDENDNIRKMIFKKLNCNYEKHIWNNKDGESYLPYDFLINDNVYVDVKSTWKSNNISFHISNDENNFRINVINNSQKYYIVIFYDIKLCNDNELNYKIKIISNDELENMKSKLNFEYLLKGDVYE